LQKKLVPILVASVEKVEKIFDVFRCNSSKAYETFQSTDTDQSNNKRKIAFHVNVNKDGRYGDRVWQVSQVVKRLMDCGVPKWEGSDPQIPQKWNTDNQFPMNNIVSSICWIFQKIAQLDETVSAINHFEWEGTVESSLLDSTIPSDSSAFIVLLTACNSDLALLEDTRSIPEARANGQRILGNCVYDIQYWLCNSCSEYIRVEKRHLAHVSTYHQALQYLRFET
jgi:hypothetical protein